MAYPNGVALAVLTLGAAGDFFGGDAVVSAKVTPVLGGTSHLVHKATGDVLVPTSMDFVSEPGGVLSVSVPIVDQPGWVDATGRAFTGWSYRVVVTVRVAKNRSVSWETYVAPVTGQSLVDLDLVPVGGEPGTPTVGEVPEVVSVVGKTGAVTADDLLAAGVGAPQSWEQITEKPETFTPAKHTHPVDDVDGLSAALAGKMPAVATSLEADPAQGVSLDTIVTPGLYVQNASAGAALALGYPYGVAGSLVVAGDTQGMVYQEYTSYATTGATAGRRWLRTRYVGTWGPWVQQALTTDPPAAHTHTWASVTGKPTTFAPAAHTHLWADVTDKPSTFAPAAHTHAISDVSGLSAALATPTVTALTGDLNNVTTPGVYLQTSSAQATLALNYPVEIAGSLVVAGNSGTMVYQEYTLYAAAGTTAGARYLRTRYNGTWGIWRQQALAQDVEATAAYRTVDGRLLEATPLQAFHTKAMSPVTESVKVVVLGSSSANGGYPSHTSLQWSWRLAARMTPNPVRRLEDVTSETRAGVWWFTGAQGGTRSSTYITDQRMANVKSLAPDVVIHMVGSNDWASSVPLNTYRDTLRSKLTEISAAVPGAVQVLVHQGGRADTTKSIAWDSYGQVMRDLAAEDPARRVFVNANAVFARAGFPSPDPWGMLIADKMHVADEGNKLYADVIGAALGIPDQGFTVPLVRTIPLAASKTYTATGDVGSLTLPAKAYPRRVVIQGMLYVKVSGQADVRADLTGGFVADTASTYARAAAGLDYHTVPVTHSGLLPAHTEGSAGVGVSLASGASLYVSGSVQYSTVTVTEYPV